MDDLISRQAAIDALNEYFDRIGKLKRRGLTKGEKAISLDTVGTIKTLPSAEPKRGKWIEYEQEFMLEGSLETVQKTVKECSVCTTKIAGMVGIMNFCPKCGAKMEETT